MGNASSAGKLKSRISPAFVRMLQGAIAMPRHRTCLDWLKDARRSEVSYDSLADRPHPSVREDGNGDEMERLMGEVGKLPLPYRETLMLYYAKDCTYGELAELLGVSAATVNMRLTKARKMLREKLGAQRA